MILSNDCWMKSYCPKNKSDASDCLQDNVFCSKLFKLDKLFNESMLSFEQRRHQILYVDSDGNDREAFLHLKEIENNISSWVNSGKNLYIYSTTCGNGKTSWSIRLIQAYLETVWYKSDLCCKALFVNVPRFLIMLKSNISQKNEYITKINENIFTADLVVWDDIGIKTATVYEMENLLNIIDYRVSNNKSNIYTSNLSPDELNDKLGDRLYSRIIKLSDIIEFVGQDKRGLVV